MTMESKPKPPRKLTEDQRSSYWRANLFVVSVLLAGWFLVAFGASIFGIEWLNQFPVGKIGLGFWFAQQGSIFAFVILVLVYALWMDRIDRRFGAGG